MTFEEWQRVKAIVAEAAEREPGLRDAFVASVCGDDDTIRREVTSLLSALEQVGERLDAGALHPGARAALRAVIRGGPVDADAGASMIGRRIGPYEIRRELGFGGMGAVYLAARVDQEFAQEVALKIIKRGMDTDAIVRRFRAERQILAGLSHPNIARLLDGGSTPDGLPYLAMEYVDGEPISAYCNAHALTIADRLQLFCRVCDAVAYAHQNLVVHRDIKPSNVLVTADGQPKLLDFGLATILNPDPGRDHDTQTVHGWMTPEFASPEQLRGDRVTTASDIYSLGVLLYELLCGRRPFAREAGGPPERAQRIGDLQPERPSATVLRNESAGTRDGTAEPPLTAAAISAARNTKPERLRRQLRGDLDTIAVKALAGDPARRYPDVRELSEDLRRHLAGLPVSARRDTFAYHATRFLRRHKAATLAAALVAATLVTSTIVTTAQARAARRERALAERRFRDVRQLATTFLFDFHDAIATLPGSTAAREMVVKTAQQYLDSLAADAGTDHELLAELSTAYVKLADVQGRPSASRLGETDAALRNYERAVELRRRLAALEPANTEFAHSLGIALVRMGPIFQVRGDPKSAAARTREGMGILDRLAVEAPSAEIRRDAFRAPFYLGDALADMGDYDGALAMYRKALAVAQTARFDPPESDFRHRLAVVSERLGIMFMVRGDYQPALDNYREALANERAMRAAEPDNAEYVRMVANGYYHIGDALRGLRNYREALAAERRALTMYEGLARADPRNASARKDLGGCTQLIADTLLAAGDHEAARKLLQQTVATRRELAEHDKGSIEYQDDLGNSLTSWGESRLAGHDAAAAIAKFEQALAILAPIVAARPEQTVYSRGLAQLYTDLGDAHALAARRAARPERDWREACRFYEQGLDLWRDIASRHAAWADETGKPDEVSRKLAICERALGEGGQAGASAPRGGAPGRSAPPHPERLAR